LTAYFGARDPQTAIEAQHLRPQALDNRIINEAIAQSVVEFPPAQSAGPFYAQFIRGPILPPYGTKERDRQLRLFYRNEYNTLWQGSIAGIIKRIASTPYTIDGPPAKAEYFQTVLQTAQFGQGWEIFLSRFLEDYFNQDYGGMVEIIAMGDPNGPLTSPVVKLAALDMGRCYVTGNPYYPFLYYSLYTNALHRMHASRIWRFVDQPSADERFLGIGLCALSRAIAAVNREIFMNRFVETRLDDKPKPGIMTSQGITPAQRQKIWNEYYKEQSADDRPAWGKVIWFDSINIDNPIKIEAHQFMQSPELFDFEKYKNLDVNEIALALGVDRQELWELSGRGMGSGAQSAVLAEKARGKTVGYIYQCIERFINVRVLPKDCEFKFKIKDETAEKTRAEIDGQLATVVQSLTGGGKAGGIAVITAEQGKAYLANASEAFSDVLTNSRGQIEVMDSPLSAVDLQNPDIAVTQDDNPIDPNQATQPGQPPAPDQPAPVQATDDGSTPRQSVEQQQVPATQPQPPAAQPTAQPQAQQAQPQTQQTVQQPQPAPAQPQQPKQPPVQQAQPQQAQPQVVQQQQAQPVQVVQKPAIQSQQPRQGQQAVQKPVVQQRAPAQPQQRQAPPRGAKGPVVRPIRHKAFEMPQASNPSSNGNGYYPQELVSPEVEAVMVVEQPTLDGCFLLSLENDPVITGLQNSLKREYPYINWQEPETFHITLVFAKEVVDVDHIGEIMPDQINPIALSLGPLDHFEDHGDGIPLILQVEPSPALIALQAELYTSLLGMGLDLSEYSIPSNYHPHITLGYLPENHIVPELDIHLSASSYRLQFTVSDANAGSDNSYYQTVFDTADTDLPTLEMLVAELVSETKDVNPITTVPQLESKAAAEYTDVSPEYPSVCANCKFYRGVGKCSIVEGHISPAGWCKHYDARPVDPTEPYEDRIKIGVAKSLWVDNDDELMEGFDATKAGNPYHDEKGRFASGGDGGSGKSEGSSKGSTVGLYKGEQKNKWNGKIDPIVHDYAKPYGDNTVGSPEEFKQLTGYTPDDFIAASGLHEVDPSGGSNATVEAGIQDGKITEVTVSYKNADVNILRTFHFDANGKPDHVYNEHFFMSEGNTGSGLGTKVFASEADQAAAMGFKYIKTQAARSPWMNGYYTWPRLGYDAEVNGPLGKTRVSDLMRSQNGRDWWKEHGDTTYMNFSLSKRSRSFKILKSYYQKRFGK